MVFTFWIRIQNEEAVYCCTKFGGDFVTFAASRGFRDESLATVFKDIDDIIELYGDVCLEDCTTTGLAEFLSSMEHLAALVKSGGYIRYYFSVPGIKELFERDLAVLCQSISEELLRRQAATGAGSVS